MSKTSVGHSAHSATERILVVDDSPTIRKVFTTYLAEYECVEAGSFDEAVAALKTTEFALVVSDIIMPGMSGIELLRKIIDEYPETEVIIVSGVARTQRVLDALRLGAFDYLIKPCEAGVLEMTVQRALEHRTLILNAREQQAALENQNAELIRHKGQLGRLQSEITQNAKMAALGQLAAGVAHELNNPVGFVYANLETLDKYVAGLTRLADFLDNAKLEPEAAAELALIQKEVDYPSTRDDIISILQDCRDGSERIIEIVQNLRTFSRLDEAGYAETDIHQGIDATTRILSRYFSAGNIRLVREFGDLPLIGAFSGPLNQVWMNLLVNAAQAIGTNNGEVKIVTKYDDECVVVQISDTGAGIAVQDLDRIFDPFYTTKPIGEGTGLGLSISFGIVERHGGSITVSSRLMEGTTFEVRLPRFFEPDMTDETKSVVPYVESDQVKLYI